VRAGRCRIRRSGVLTDAAVTVLGWRSAIPSPLPLSRPGEGMTLQR
jgi:hypothetical protein